MSQGPWNRCPESGRPIGPVQRSDWIRLHNARQSLEERFPGNDVFCLSCIALQAEYKERYLQDQLVYNPSNPLRLGSAQIISGNPGEGYVFAGHSATLMKIGNERRGRKKKWDNLLQETVTCPRCGRSHTLYRV